MRAHKVETRLHAASEAVNACEQHMLDGNAVLDELAAATEAYNDFMSATAEADQRARQTRLQADEAEKGM